METMHQTPSCALKLNQDSSREEGLGFWLTHNPSYSKETTAVFVLKDKNLKLLACTQKLHPTFKKKSLAMLINFLAK